MKFAIRVDDVGWTSTPAAERPLKVPDSGLELARRFNRALDGLPWLAAVIPSALDKEGTAWLASRPDGVTVALHGVTHKRVDGADSEFRGMSEDRCRVELDFGLHQLGIRTRHFVPPFNALEPGLEKAFQKTGIEIVWWTYTHDLAKPYKKGEKTTFVTAYWPLYGATLVTMGEGPRPIVETLPRLLGVPGYAVITLHLPWEAARCDGADFEGVREMVKILRRGDHVLPPDEYVEAASA